MSESTTEATFRLSGRISMETRWADTGALIPEESGWSDNIVVDVGLVELASIIAQEAETQGFQIGVGTSSTAAASTQTGLLAQVYRANVTQVTRAGAVVTFKLYVDTSSANGSTLVEAGLFHNNVLIDRAIVTSVAKTASKTVTVVVELTISR